MGKLERGVTVMAQTRHSHPDPIEEGARARIHGRPKDACPYSRDSEERASWMEGYDGAPRENRSATNLYVRDQTFIAF
jgi:ribosome modulation factor